MLFVRVDDKMCREVYRLLLLVPEGLKFFSGAVLPALLNAIAYLTGVNGT